MAEGIVEIPLTSFSSLIIHLEIVRWWCTPLISELRRQRQADLCEFEAGLVYKSQFQDRNQRYRETLSLKKQRNKKEIVDSLTQYLQTSQICSVCLDYTLYCRILLWFLSYNFLICTELYVYMSVLSYMSLLLYFFKHQKNWL